MSHSPLPSASLTLAALDWRLLQPEDLPAMHALHLCSIEGMAAQTVKPETRGFLHGLLLGRGRVIGAWHGFWVAYVGIPGFIVTLSGMLLFRGMTFRVLNSVSLSPM